MIKNRAETRQFNYFEPLMAANDASCISGIENEIDVVDVLGTANMDWTPLGESFVRYEVIYFVELLNK